MAFSIAQSRLFVVFLLPSLLQIQHFVYFNVNFELSVAAVD